MIKRFWWSLWLMVGLLGVGLAQSDEYLVDRLHGFKVRLPEGWRCTMIEGMPVFYKQHAFVVVGGVAYQQSLKEVGQKLVQNLRKIQLNQPRLAFRPIPQGVQIVGEGLGYPYAFNPLAVMEDDSLPKQFSLVGFILKGKEVALLVLFFFPNDASTTLRKEMGELVRTLEFLPAARRVKWKTVVLDDPYLNMPFGTLHVPEGYTVEGTPFRQGAKYMYRYEVKQGDFITRMDSLEIQTSIVGGGGMSVLTYNGRSVPLEAGVVLSRPEEAEEVILMVWQVETGREWKVTRRQVRERNLPPSPFPLPPASERKSWGISLTAESGDLERIAYIRADFFTAVQADPLVSSGSHQTMLMVDVSQYPKQKREAYQGIIVGIANSFRANPQWAIAAFAEFTQENKRINKQVREMLEQMREENSRMARAWANALSDQTYIRDPESGEVFKVHKRVWDTNNFWRDPVFGEIIGTIGKETALGKLLREEGWKVMDESLSGFP